MKIGDKVQYKTSKNSLKPFFGKIVGFKQDKIHVTKFRYSDFSGHELPNTYIEATDLI